MNQISIGSYIAEKRRALNLTQEQLAEKLGVSNKTISKWENGKCMPDYGIIQKLCETLHVTLRKASAPMTMTRFLIFSAARRSWNGNGRCSQAQY